MHFNIFVWSSTYVRHSNRHWLPTVSVSDKRLEACNIVRNLSVAFAANCQSSAKSCYPATTNQHICTDNVSIYANWVLQSRSSWHMHTLPCSTCTVQKKRTKLQACKHCIRSNLLTCAIKLPLNANKKAQHHLCLQQFTDMPSDYIDTWLEGSITPAPKEPWACPHAGWPNFFNILNPAGWQWPP